MTTFQDFNLIAPLKKALDALDYVRPTAIQQQAIPPGIEGRDILGCAQTGTGKTASFALPILDSLQRRPDKTRRNQPRALVLAPTRELAIQIGSSLESYGRYLKLRTTTVYGGVKQTSQVRSLERGTDILVATPGRLLDLMQQGHVYLDRLEILVLDEADRMLDMGFLPDIRRIVRELPRNRQSLFFSATLAPEITRLAKQLLSNPVTIQVAPESGNVGQISQQVELVPAGEKIKRLCQILTTQSVKLAIVFTRTKRGADKVQKKLQQQGHQAAAIHGNKSQGNRQRTLASFRSGKTKVLVATDVAARGLDVDAVSHVINFDLPGDPESYVHRIGRTGRAGAKGQAITFYSSDQLQELRAIEQFVGMPISSDGWSSRESNPRRGRPSKSRSNRNAVAGGNNKLRRRRRKSKPADSPVSRTPAAHANRPR